MLTLELTEPSSISGLKEKPFIIKEGSEFRYFLIKRPY